MRKLLLPLLALILCASCTHTYYVVRHGEKNEAATGGTTTNSTPLSTDGNTRAEDLRKALDGKNIAYVFSTNTERTRATGRPTALAQHADTILYALPNADSTFKFISRLKKIKRNVLIVGHSNTVDDIVNKLTNKTSVAADLLDSDFDNLFIVHYVTFFGTNIKFEHRTYGKPTPP